MDREEDKRRFSKKIAGLDTPLLRLRGQRRLGLLAVLATAFMGLMAAPVLAAPIHPYITQFDGEDSPLGSFENPSGIAVDSQGDIYTGNYFGSEAYVLDPSGHFLAGIPIQSANSLAVDSLGDVYVSAGNNGVQFGTVTKFTPSSFPVTTATTYSNAGVVAQHATAVAVNPANDNVLVDEATRIVEFDPTGAEVRSFGSGAQGNSSGVAVDGSSGDIYVLHPVHNEMQAFSVSATGGTYTLSIGGKATAPIAYNAPISQVIAQLESLSTVGSGNVQAVNTEHNLNQIEFFHALAGKDVEQMTADSSQLTGAGAGVSIETRYGGVGQGTVDKFDAAGAPVDFSALSSPSLDGSGSTAGAFAEPAGLALDQSNGDILVIDRRVPKDAEAGDQEGVIDQFEPSGEFVLQTDASQTPQSTFSFSREGSGIAVDGSSSATAGRLYVSRPGFGGGVVDVFGPIADLPDLATQPAADITRSTVTLHGTIVPNGKELESCTFEYGETESYGRSVPCSALDGHSISGPAEIPADNALHTLSAELTGLIIGHTYHYRLVTKVDLGTSIGISRANAETFVMAGPAINGEKVSHLFDTSVRLEGTVDPNGHDTNYLFQYVTEAGYAASGFADATSIPAGGVQIEGSGSALPVTQEVTGLDPATTYYYRIVAVSECEPDVRCSAEGESDESSDGVEIPHKLLTYAAGQNFSRCSNDALRIGFSALLPDCRAYEQATPVEKLGVSAQGSEGMADGVVVEAAAGGGASTFEAESGLPGAEGAQEYGIFLTHRTPDAESWSTQGLMPPASLGAEAFVVGWTEDLSRSYVTAKEFGGPNGLYERRNSGGPLHLIADVEGNEPSFIAATESGTAMAFEGEVAPTAGRNLFLWDPATEKVTLVSVLNSGQSVKGVGGDGPLAGSAYRHALSADGETLIFTGVESGKIYIRRNIRQPQSPRNGQGRCTVAADACTIEASASRRQPADPNGAQRATFWGGTASGSAAFFTSPGALTGDANTGPEDKGADLYRYEVAGEALTDLTPDQADPNGAEVREVLGSAADGSYLYFTANGVLAANEGFEGGHATHGACSTACNIYLWTAGDSPGAGHISYVGAARAPQIPNGEEGPLYMRARVSAEGGVLLFPTESQLTGFENHGAQEYYRYSATSGDLDCVTCNPSEVAPLGPASLHSIKTNGSIITPFPIETRNLSANGDRVFFETPDPLVASDVNSAEGCPQVAGRTSCLDVYEWEVDGTGSCQSTAQDGGCLYLLSTGKESQPSYFGDASADGDDVFIFTTQPLVGQDKDQLVDLYDARTGGGMAAQFPQAPSPCVSAEACKAAGSAAAPQASPGSASFVGPGNPTKKNKKHKSSKKHKEHRKHKKASTQKHHRNNTQSGHKDGGAG